MKRCLSVLFCLLFAAAFFSHASAHGNSDVRECTACHAFDAAGTPSQAPVLRAPAPVAAVLVAPVLSPARVRSVSLPPGRAPPAVL